MITVMSFSLVACGGDDSGKKEPSKSAYDISKEAYDKIKIAHDITEAFASDLYEAWRLGIYDDDEVRDGGAKYLAKELSLSEKEIIDGLVYSYYGNDEDYNNASASEKENIKNKVSVFFTGDSIFSSCVFAVSGAYKVNGKVKEAQDAIDEAKALMKELSSDYSDYEHYPSLKEFFTNTSAYFDFCQNPDGSFEQVKNTINDYRNKSRELNNDLNFIFED